MLPCHTLVLLITKETYWNSVGFFRYSQILMKIRFLYNQ